MKASDLMRLDNAPSPNSAHRPVLRTPFYAVQGILSGAAAHQPQLHEYRGTDFMRRFAADLRAQSLTSSVRQNWFERNRLDGKRHPTLRQAIHDGHYLVCCELSCGGRQQAPLDPRRVIQAWITVSPYQDEAIAQAVEPKSQLRVASTPDGENLVTRSPTGHSGQLEIPMRAAMQRLQAQLAVGAGIGREISFPLRPELVSDGQGHRHTLLSGLLPVDEAVQQLSRQAPNVLDDSVAQDASASALAARFGDDTQPLADDQMLWDGSNIDARLTALVQLLDENLAIGTVDGELAFTAAIGAADADNADGSLTAWLDWLGDAYFYVLPETAPYDLFVAAQKVCATAHGRARANLVPALLPLGSSQALRDAVDAVFDALHGNTLPSRTQRVLRFTQLGDYGLQRINRLVSPWRQYVSQRLALVDAAITRASSGADAGLMQLEPVRQRLREYRDALRAVEAAALGLQQQFSDPLRYRRQSLLQWLTGERVETDKPLTGQLPAQRRLIVAATWMNRGPALVRARWLSLIRQLAEDWSDAGLGQADDGDEQLYRIKVHARVRSEQGCEYFVHSEFGEPFYIASYYETRLMPPRPIRMPSLKDLKKAVAGPAMVLPEDTAAEISKLRFPDGKVEQSGGGAAGRWIYMFSIPIVTMCAMILLMLMVTILDFIFRWIPYAILRIPIPGRSSE